MRVKVLLRHAACLVYTVECRHHERPVWIDENSSRAELVYPLSGGYLLHADGGPCTCLPARLSVLPAGSSYRIRHFRGLPDSTLVIRISKAQSRMLPNQVSHLFLAPTEAAGLHLLAATMCNEGVGGALDGLPALIADMLRRIHAAAIPHAPLATQVSRLERSLERLLLDHDASVAECAHAAGCSEDHFRHGFRDHYRTTPHKVRRALRLARALRFLLQGGTAAAAARVSGFAHASHLSGELRRLTGRSPTMLLRAHHAHGVCEAKRLWGHA